MGRTSTAKEAFAAEIESMLGSMPLSQVRVKDLCERCGVERRVFYYHFKDKYDLVAWIFERDYLGAIAESKAPHTEETVALALEKIWSRRGFYRRALEDDSQNSVADYIHEVDVDFGIQAVKRHYGVREIPIEWMYAIRHHSHGCIGCTFEWLSGEICATPCEHARHQFACMPQFLREAYAHVPGEPPIGRSVE